MSMKPYYKLTSIVGKEAMDYVDVSAQAEVFFNSESDELLSWRLTTSFFHKKLGDNVPMISEAKVRYEFLESVVIKKHFIYLSSLLWSGGRILIEMCLVGRLY